MLLATAGRKSSSCRRGSRIPRYPQHCPAGSQPRGRGHGELLPALQAAPRWGFAFFSPRRGQANTAPLCTAYARQRCSLAPLGLGGGRVNG